MTITEQIDGYINAMRWTDTVHVSDLLRNAKETIEKLEQDRKVLRWALTQVQDSLVNDTYYLNGAVLSILETAKVMTEPANDR